MKYIGNCTEDIAWQSIFFDASDMAYAISNSFYLSKDEFSNRMDKDDSAFKILVNECTVFGTIRNIVWAYNEVKDKHYFWVE